MALDANVAWALLACRLEAAYDTDIILLSDWCAARLNGLSRRLSVRRESGRDRVPLAIDYGGTCLAVTGRTWVNTYNPRPETVWGFATGVAPLLDRRTPGGMAQFHDALRRLRIIGMWFRTKYHQFPESLIKCEVAGRLLSKVSVPLRVLLIRVAKTLEVGTSGAGPRRRHDRDCAAATEGRGAVHHAAQHSGQP